jgi:hypothetical protein
MIDSVFDMMGQFDEVTQYAVALNDFHPRLHKKKEELSLSCGLESYQGRECNLSEGITSRGKDLAATILFVAHNGSELLERAVT